MTPTTRKPYTVIAPRHGGTHLIIPTVRFLTRKTVYSPKGEDALTCEPSPVVIVFLRDPRNWLVSAYKWKHGRTSVDKDDRALARFIVDRRGKAMSPLEFAMALAERWIGWHGSLTVRFENMLPPGGVDETKRIAEFIGPAAFRDPETVYAEVYGQSGTYTGQPSDWRAWFGERTMRAWAEAGGPDLLQKMGYE